MSDETVQLQLQLAIQTLKNELNLMAPSIAQSVVSQLGSEDYYSKLIELVEKITAVNTQMVNNQAELEDLIKNQVLPVIESIKESDELTAILADLQTLLHGERFKLMDMVEDVHESGVVPWIKKIAIFGVVFIAIVGFSDVLPKIFSVVKSLFGGTP